MIFLKKWWPVLGAAALAILILSVAYCSGRTAGRQGEVVEQLEREGDTLRDLGSANENAAGRRLDDMTRAERQAEELNDALETANDPDRQRTLRGCIILRQQGRDTSNIPACR